jgi:GNAT superfamily N-acetyltransferase
MDEAAAQKAIEEEQAYQQRVFKPTEEGFLEAPVTKTLELLGQSLPFMVLPVAAAGATLALPVTGAAATVAGLGAAGLASGAQFTGTNLLRQMEPTDEAPKGKSIGETDLGNAALAAVPQAALDVLSLRMMPFIRGVFGQVGKDLSEEAARRIASKNLKDVAADYALATGKTMTVEGLTEAAQQSLERLQAGLTMTDEAARDEYLESFIGGAVLGGVLAPPGRYLERRAAQKEVPPETKPEPTATQPTAPTPMYQRDELTPEEEAELQARIAAAPPPPAAVLAEPTPPIPPTPAPAAVQQVTATPEAVALPETQQVTPQAAPELEALTAQLGQIQQARMDPTLSPDDPAFLEFDQQEAAIQSRIQQLTAPPVAVTQPPAQPLAPEITSPAAPVITPIIAQTPPSPLQAPKGAADNFLDAVVTQFGMDRGEAQKALDTLVQEELIELDPNSGQFRMKDGRFWDPDVMRKAAAMQTAAPPLQLPQPLAPPVAPVVEPEVIPEEAMVTPEIQVPFDETLTPPGPTLEDQVRAQKAEERRERQAAQEAKKGEFVLQNRDRSSTGSIQQMQNIANAPDYSRAGFSRTPDGAPIIAFGDYAPEQLGREDVVTTARGRKIPVQYAVVEADEVITSNDIQGRADNRYGDKSVPGPRAIAGNGRVTGLREAFERGTATPYVEEMAADSALHGISPDVIAGMKKPVLVRVMPQEGLTRDIGDELNISSMLELSPVEQAKNDLNRVEFDALQFDEDGEITNESLSQFIAAQPVEERTKLIDRGLPTKQARQRLENAIFARAYADDDLIAMFAQTEDVEARLVINALAQVAPQMAQLEGAGDLDIRDIVTDAAKIIVSGKRRGLKLRDISSQVDMTVDPDTKIIVDMFAQNPRSNKAAIESLRNAAELAYNESIRPEEGLFGVEPRRERRDIMEQMRRGYEPTRTEDVAAAERPGPAPSDVERKAEPSAATVPPADQDFALTGQTPEELAELQRRELSGEAEAERDRLEAEEAAKAAEIAAKKVAEQKGEQPGDLAPTTGKMELSAPPITDLFGTQGITDQPVRGPRRVAAEPSPIEKLAAKEPTVDEAIEEELKKAGYDDLGKMSKNIQDEFGVGKPVADAYARAVQNARIQVVRSQFGLVTESQLREALNEQTKLRNRIDGIVKRKEPKKEPEAEKKPSIRKTREVAEGTVVERIELPDNIEIRIVKLKNGYSVYQYDLDADQIVMGQQRQFRTPAFKNDQDAYQAAEAFASDMFDKVVPKMADEMQAAMKERLSRGEDVINNKTPDPDIPADQRLVLMACCATKKKGMGMGPAIEVYTGVFFQTLKNKLKEGAMPNLRILSAKYGFIAPDQKIEVYDQVMDKSSADGFMLDDKLVEGFPSNIKDVLIVGSDQYQRVMKAAIEDLIKAGKIDKGASINVTKGGIGEQRSQLGKYLASLPVKKEPEGKKTAKTPLAFYQQMIPDAGFKRLDLDDPRTYKNKSGEQFVTFERDGVRVAVKSNTQLYADGRGVGMYMGNDNDLLIQAMIVDESARRQGKATKALQDILSMADQAGMTSYIEPVQMTKDVGMTTEQLKDFYKQFGFKPQKTEPVTDRVMVREPGAKIETKKEEKPKAEEFVRGTEEQLKEIKEFAKRYGGSEVAYYDPDKDIGMVLAFGKFDGDPKYIPYIKGVLVGRRLTSA